MTNYPTAFDDFNNPSASDPLNGVGVQHASQHANANDAIEALQRKVGVNGSAVTSSIDYRVAQLETELVSMESVGGQADIYIGLNGGVHQFKTVVAGKGIYFFATGETLTFNAGLRDVETITAASDTLDSDNDVVFADTSSNNITLNLPAAADNGGLELVVKKTSAANTLTIVPSGAETIDGQSSIEITTQYTALCLVSDGSNWWII